MTGFAAVVLAGGRGTRLGGVDKPALVIGGRTLLDRALAAVSRAEQIVVVGPRRPTTTPVRWTVEQPAGAGPVAALAAGIAALSDPPEELVLLAADLLAVNPDTVQRLRGTLAGEPAVAGVLLVDAGGHRQWLTGVWRLPAVRAALPAQPANQSLQGTLGTLAVLELAARPGETADLDTREDLAKARRQD